MPRGRPRGSKNKRVAGGVRRRYASMYQGRARKFQGYSNMRTFTETLAAGSISTQSGGVFKVSMASVPQISDYATLYSQFCIRRLKVMLLPRYGQSDPNAALSLTGPGIYDSRLAFAVNDTPVKLSPTSEIDVLTDNGCRVVQGTKKISIRCDPKPDIALLDNATGIPAAIRSSKETWFNFRNSTTGTNGENVEHGGISWWLSGNPAVASLPVYDVYYKVTFSVRDPS